MKIITRLSLLALILFLNFNTVQSQQDHISKEYKEQVIRNLSQLMNDFYVFPDVAKLTEEHLNKQFKNGHFDQFKNDKSFAKALTKSVQYINKDKHMRIWQNPYYEAPKNSPERKIEERIDRINQSRRGNYGFKTVKILEGNVGYLDLRGFAGLGNGKEFADAAMKIMSRSDAIIVDLQKNGGGSPNMVQYLCSFFFNKKLHLNSLYWRQGNETREFWTLDEVGGDKMPDVPLFIITSNRTFSGAEEFSYNMQTQKRATLIGQITGGGANPGGTRRINDNLSVFIPTGKAINPITQTNWEGIGVIPEIKTSEEESFNKAYELAKESAQAFRNKKKKTFSKLLISLNNKLENYQVDTSYEDLLAALTLCHDNKLLHEGDINGLGYEYLLEHKKPDTAEAIFKANTQLFPNSANVFDSYAESFMLKGDFNSSLKYYQKAVEIAKANKDTDLDLFKNNLAKLKEKLRL